jgi:hypothetical protein
VRWDNGEHLTDEGRAAVVELAHVDATREDLQRRVLAAKPSGRHRAADEFVESFAEAAVEHTAELEAIAVEVPVARRFGRWVTRNLTRARVSALLLSVAVVLVVGGVWAVAR